MNIRDMLRQLPDCPALSPRERALVANACLAPMALYSEDALKRAQRMLRLLCNEPVPAQFCAEFGLSEEEGRHRLAHFERFCNLSHWPYILSLEGLDGSGKQVQTTQLQNYFSARGVRVLCLDFPQYDSYFGREIGSLLAGTDKRNAATLDVRSMALWFAMDRWNTLRDIEVEWYDVILLNRFTLSNVAFQCARQGGEYQPELVEWINTLEHTQLRLPVPDLYLYLDVNSSISRRNNDAKAFRAYKGDRGDVYEDSASLQDCARAQYRELTARQSNVRVIDCLSEENAMRSIEGIHAEIVEYLEREWTL